MNSPDSFVASSPSTSSSLLSPSPETVQAPAAENKPAVRIVNGSTLGIALHRGKSHNGVVDLSPKGSGNNLRRTVVQGGVPRRDGLIEQLQARIWLADPTLEMDGRQEEIAGGDETIGRNNNNNGYFGREHNQHNQQHHQLRRGKSRSESCCSEHSSASEKEGFGIAGPRTPGANAAILKRNDPTRLRPSGHYIKHKLLGSGSYGETWLVEYVPQQQAVVSSEVLMNAVQLHQRSRRNTATINKCDSATGSAVTTPTVPRALISFDSEGPEILFSEPAASPAASPPAATAMASAATNHVPEATLAARSCVSHQSSSCLLGGEGGGKGEAEGALGVNNNNNHPNNNIRSSSSIHVVGDPDRNVLLTGRRLLPKHSLGVFSPHDAPSQMVYAALESAVPVKKQQGVGVAISIEDAFSSSNSGLANTQQQQQQQQQSGILSIIQGSSAISGMRNSQHGSSAATTPPAETISSTASRRYSTPFVISAHRNDSMSNSAHMTSLKLDACPSPHVDSRCWQSVPKRDLRWQPMPGPSGVSSLASTSANFSLGCGTEIPSGRAFVCKTILRNPTRSGHHATLDEINVLANCAHPCILGYVESFVQNGRVHVITEYMDKGDLEHELEQRRVSTREMSESKVLSIFGQLCLALEYLHRHNMLHRDVKPANVLLSKLWLVKLCDFGFAKQCDMDVDMNVSTSRLGTPYYMAPELWESRPYSAKADMWSLGVLFYELLTLDKPFACKSLAELQKLVTRGEYTPITRGDVSDEAIEIVKALLVVDPEKRLTAKQVLQMPIMQDMLKRFLHQFEHKAAVAAASSPIDVHWCEVLKEHAVLLKQDADESSTKSRQIRKRRRTGSAQMRRRSSTASVSSATRSGSSGGNSSRGISPTTTPARLRRMPKTPQPSSLLPLPIRPSGGVLLATPAAASGTVGNIGIRK